MGRFNEIAFEDLFPILARLFPPTRGSTACIFHRCRRLSLFLVGEFVSCRGTNGRTQLKPRFYRINSRATGSKTLSTNDNWRKRSEATQFHQRLHFLPIPGLRLFPATGHQRSKLSSGRPKKNLLLAPAVFAVFLVNDDGRRTEKREFQQIYIARDSRVCEAALVKRWTSWKLCGTSTQSHSGRVVSPSNDNNFPLFLHLYRPERK